MMSGQSGQRQASRHLSNVLHSMLVKSRTEEMKRRSRQAGNSGGHDMNSLSNGDPRESTLWGEGV